MVITHAQPYFIALRTWHVTTGAGAIVAILFWIPRPLVKKNAGGKAIADARGE